jgi:tRNA(fMet)-specific endonuclease VapC
VKYVLDTNIAVAALNAHLMVVSRLAGLPRDEVGLPLLVLAELLFGARNSRRMSENRAKVEALRASVPILAVTEAVAERYGIVRADVERRGRPKSDFDLVIACTALEHGAVLVTNDGSLKDGSIEGLEVEDWLATPP